MTKSSQLTTIDHMKELNFQEQAFVACYSEHFKAARAAREACYSESVSVVHAHRWVSLTSCPPNKRHVYNAVQAEIAKRYGDELPDAAWVLKRARLLADFNISSFVTANPEGTAVYDFSNATDDDWYCISEYTVEAITKGRGPTAYDVERTKLKGHCKLRALELVGKHTGVQAFVDRKEISGPGGGPIVVAEATLTKEQALTLLSKHDLAL